MMLSLHPSTFVLYQYWTLQISELAVTLSHVSLWALGESVASITNFLHYSSYPLTAKFKELKELINENLFVN